LALFTESNLEELRMDPTEGCSKPPDDCHVGDISKIFQSHPLIKLIKPDDRILHIGNF